MKEFDEKDTKKRLIQKYVGVPNESSTKEKSNWKKFFEFLTSWLSEKKNLGERYLAAKVKNEEAEAMSKMADAILKIEQAKKIARESRTLENEKMLEIGDKNFTTQEIEEMVKNIEDKIKVLSIVKDASIEIETLKLTKGKED